MVALLISIFAQVFVLGQAETNRPAAAEPGEGKPAAEAASTNAPPYRMPQVQILTFPVPLGVPAKTAVLNSKNPMVEYARAAIAVPRGFDREIATPILLVNGTSDGDGSSIRAMHAYTNVALRMGWLVIAADGPFGKPLNDNPPWRWAMISSLLEHMNKTWPGSDRWPIASVGYSGGGKWAGVIGAILAKRGYNLIGVFMGAVNEDYASEAAKIYDPAVRFKKVPIYLSSGTDDKLATPEQHTDVRESLLHHGFSTVRLETFKGGHALAELELRKALRWFMEQFGRADAMELEETDSGE